MGQILSIYWKNGADWIQSLQTMRGRGTQKQCHFAGSPLFWRGYWPWQKDDAEFALINVKVPLKSGCRGVFFPTSGSFSVRKTHWFILRMVSDLISVMARPSLYLLSLCQSHLVTVLILYVATVYWHFSDSSPIRCSECILCCCNANTS